MCYLIPQASLTEVATATSTKTKLLAVFSTYASVESIVSILCVEINAFLRRRHAGVSLFQSRSLECCSN